MKIIDHGSVKEGTVTISVEIPTDKIDQLVEEVSLKIMDWVLDMFPPDPMYKPNNEISKSEYDQVIESQNKNRAAWNKQVEQRAFTLFREHLSKSYEQVKNMPEYKRDSLGRFEVSCPLCSHPEYLLKQCSTYIGQDCSDPYGYRCQCSSEPDPED